MDFFSPIFLLFYLVILVAYYTINNRFQPVLLFLASSAFILSFSAVFLIYTYIFIILNYIVGHAVVNNNSNLRLKKLFYSIGLFLNIGSLVFFKYINFLLSSIVDFLNIFDAGVSDITLKIILPLGISYYTFQGIGYLIQLYRGNETLVKNVLVYSNYYLFYPKFLAGPIEQSKNFIPQLQRLYDFDYSRVVDGFRLMLWGAFKKLVIADRLALVINGVYPNLDEMSGNIFLFTFLLQPIQLYFDFSGYTDIALGMGKTFGFNLTDNFRRPFFSKSVTEFWQRWHISLSSWCNEFIFKRLTFKNRRWGIWSPVYAVFITFLVIGIWHGPRWNFLILGVLQGLAINYEYFTKRWRMRVGGYLPRSLVRYISYLLVYLFFCLTLVFFNAVEVNHSIYFLSNILVDINLRDLSLMFLSNNDKVIVLVSTLFIIITELRAENGKEFFSDLNKVPKAIRFIFYYILAIMVIYFSGTSQSFVYMQF